MRTIWTVDDALSLIGEGMRLCVPEDGSAATLVEGIARNPRPHPTVLVSPDVLKDLTTPPRFGQLYEMKENGDWSDGKKTRGGWNEFYSGRPAKLYCMVV